MKLISIFNQTGNSTLNVEEVVNQWDNMFSLIGWINETEEKYTLVVNEEKHSTKIKITKEQALELIYRLNLIKEKGITRSGCSWHKKEYYHFEIERLNKLIAEKSKDIEMQDALIIAKEIIAEYLRLV